MSRPTVRPSAPYTRCQIKDMVWNHFIVEGYPQCVDANSNFCIYGQTGCAVGCVMTQADAEYIDSTGFIPVGILPAKIYSAYFNRIDIEFLEELQEWHDERSNNFVGCFRSQQKVKNLLAIYEKYK